ncbi:site-specific integrase [Erythrobacter sp.]|uniref:site-specific integrase n=1 Tax=Erythrobacter sp. TaxID=1042 RepID=UPI0025F606B2|nr:site-specific integrase [Erythrobacter sp.]
MPIVPLDAAYCAAATCPSRKKKVDYYDKELKGFVLEVRASGGKSYYLRYAEPNGRQRQLLIGGWQDVTFAAAKKKAQRLRSEVVLGGDPLGDRKRTRLVPTYAELARQHIDHAKTYQKRPENTASVITIHLVPRWGKHRLDEIKPQDISKWLGQKRETLAPATVEKLRVTLGRTFELARQWNLPGAEINPVRSVPRFQFDNARDHYLTATEVERLLYHADRSLNPRLGAIVRLLLLTGARKSELLTAEWRHVDLERRAWLIPDSKTGKARYVPLSGEAVKVIEGLPRLKDCAYMLANPNTKKPYTGLKNPWDTVRTKANLNNLRIHDLRHSAASFLINSNVELFTVGKILGHADFKSTMRYSHLANDTLMAAVEAGAAKMGGTAS